MAFLPSNFHLNREVQQDKAVQRIISTPPPVCVFCDEDSSFSVAYCKDCDCMLCKKCLNVHKKSKALNSHATFITQDLKQKSRSDLLELLPASESSDHLCPDHSDKKLGFYCTQCALPLCEACISNRHKDHPVEEVSDEQVTDKKAKVLQSMDELSGSKKQIELAVVAVDQAKKSLQNVKNEAYNVIEEAFAEVRQLVDQRERALLVKCKQLAMAKETYLSSQLEHYQCLLESMSQCQCLASIATSQYTDVQLLSIAQTLQDRAVYLQKLCADASLNPCETPDISVEANVDLMVGMVAEFGGVTDSSSNNNATDKVSFKESDVVAGVTAEVTIQIDSSVGELNREEIDYTKLKDPIQIISDLIIPFYLAFADNGDMFVTTWNDPPICVYDNSGKKMTTIGCIGTGSGELQFNHPCGIDISSDMMYVAELHGHRIHKLTIKGEFICTIGEKGTDMGQFDEPYDVKIGPDKKVYVADGSNHRIQVFHSDWTISHVINGRVSGEGGFSHPKAIAFDQLGNVHVAGFSSNSVAVFTPGGQFVHYYDKAHTHSPFGIAINSSGHSFVTEYRKGLLSIFDSHGQFMHSVENLSTPRGVSISPDGSIWVADTGNYRLAKY